MMRIKIKYLFNMIEVTLAIGILAVGATAVMALFPLGFNKNKESMGQNYISEEASSLLAYIASVAINPDPNGDGSETGWELLFTGSSPAIPIEKTISDDNPDTTGDWGNSITGNIYYVPEYNPNSGHSIKGVYGLKVTNNNVESFTGKASIWRGSVGSISNNISIGVFMEISWPVNRPYNTRKKNYYYVELFNYNNPM